MISINGLVFRFIGFGFKIYLGHRMNLNNETLVAYDFLNFYFHKDDLLYHLSPHIFYDSPTFC